MLNRDYAPTTGKRRGKGPRTRRAKRRHKVRRIARDATAAGIAVGTTEWGDLMARHGLDRTTRP